MTNDEEQIMLPTTEEQFDKLIDDLTGMYALPNKEHASAVVANRIMHLPADQATSTMRYLGHSVLKNIAYQVAQSKGMRIAHKAQIDQLIQTLKATPNDQQSRDAITKAIGEGSEYAKAEIEKLEPQEVPTIKGPALQFVE